MGSDWQGCLQRLLMQEMEKHPQLLTHYLCLCVKQVLREIAETEMLDISGKIIKDYHRYAKMDVDSSSKN